MSIIKSGDTVIFRQNQNDKNAIHYTVLNFSYDKSNVALREHLKVGYGNRIESVPVRLLMLASDVKEKVNDLSDMDEDFTLSVLKNVLLDKCLELAATFEDEGVQSETYRLKLAHIKSLGESIKKLED